MAQAPLAPGVLRGLLKELKDLQATPDEGVRVIVNEDNVADVQAEIDGPAGTPYEGGLFRMKLVLGSDYPSAPPKGWFLTKLFHPNVSKSGEICVNVLKRDWAPSTGLRHVLQVIRCLLIQPFPDSALNEEAGKLLQENYEEYARHAKLLTSIHAQHAKRPMPLTAEGGANAVNAAGGSEQAGNDSGSPVMKRAKGGDKKARPAAAKSKSLKRL